MNTCIFVYCILDKILIVSIMYHKEKLKKKTTKGSEKKLNMFFAMFRCSIFNHVNVFNLNTNVKVNHVLGINLNIQCHIIWGGD